jgi:hypothetical protein
MPKVMIPPEDWLKDTSTALQKHLPAGVSPKSFNHFANGACMVEWDEPATPDKEKTKV